MRQLLFVVLSLWMFGGATVAASAQQDDAYAVVYDSILQKNADGAVASCAAMEDAVKNPGAGTRRAAFTDLATAWARVQASYILGGYDIDAVDYPLLISYFHIGNENIPRALAAIIAGNTAPRTALYKNSYKTLTALDFVMFGGNWSARRAALSEVIVARICSNIGRVADGYKAARADYLSDPQKALSLLVNALIENVYKTRDWRLGEVVGLTKQTLGQFLPHNQQYPSSEASWAVIGANIETYEQLLSPDSQPNLATVADRAGASKGMAAVQSALAQTRKAYVSVPLGQQFSLKEAIPLFEGLQAMQKAFYTQLVIRLGVTAGIVDADGD